MTDQELQQMFLKRAREVASVRDAALGGVSRVITDSVKYPALLANRGMGAIGIRTPEEEERAKAAIEWGTDNWAGMFDGYNQRLNRAMVEHPNVELAAEALSPAGLVGKKKALTLLGANAKRLKAAAHTSGAEAGEGVIDFFLN